MMDLLKQLGLAAVNSGVSTGQWWAEISQTNLLESVNPATGKVIATVSCGNSDDYDRVLQTATLNAQQWRQIPAPKRGDIIRQIGEALRSKKEALGTLVTMEMGKIKQEGDGEVQEMIDIADFAVGQSRMLYGNTMHSERPQHRMYEQWHPLGITGILTAFNFPVAVWAWNACISAICGNVNIWKPSPKTPLTAIAVQKICNEVTKANGFEGIFSLFITNENALAEKLVADERVNLVSFTGSTAVGRAVALKVAARMGKCLLELGGNNAIILDETANMKLAIPAIAFGAVGTAGQRCTTTRRVIAHKSIIDKVAQSLIHAYSQVKVGDPLDASVLMGPLIDDRAVDNYLDAINRIRELNGEILCGGSRLAQPGYFVEPTIVRGIPNDNLLIQTETFAPILYLIPYEKLAQAIAIQNDVPQGLSSAIFTEKVQVAEQFLSAVGSDCGIANVNIGTSGAEIGGAFGGEKETGGGREAGSDAWKAYMRRQTSTINWSSELPLAQGIKFDITV